MIPRFTLGHQTICDPEWEATGRTLEIVWLGIVFQISLARIER